MKMRKLQDCLIFLLPFPFFSLHFGQYQACLFKETNSIIWEANVLKLRS